MNKKLPPHIAYSQQFTEGMRYNLSNSCAQALTFSELMAMASAERQSAINSLTLSYSSTLGDETLRQHICEFHSKYALPSTNQSANQIAENETLLAKHVLCFSGAQEALQAVYQAVLTAGDEIIVFTPCYPSLVSMAESLGVKVKKISIEASDSWQFNIDKLAAELSIKTKLVVINSPQNPTGAVLSAQQQAQVLSLIKPLGCYLLSDDVSQASTYCQLSPNEESNITHHHLLSYAKTIAIGVMSKSFGFGGIRLGWLVSQDESLLTACLAQKCYGSICCSALDEQLAITVFENQHDILQRNNALIAHNINLFSQLVQRYPHILAWKPPRAGIMTIVHWLPKINFKQWLINVANQYGLLILPTHLFYLEENYFRLGLGQSNFEEILAVFENALQQLTVQQY